MSNDDHASLQYHAGADTEIDLKEIVMGLHWHPPEEGTAADEAPANLDALCILFDAQQSVLEVIHPGHPRNANGSVLHTGDSRTGASEWDDERIFVFLEALPETVSSLAFVVTSPTRRVLREVPGASCHVSDRITERAWVQLDLTALGDQREYTAATLRRGPTGWEIIPGDPGTSRGP
jgi:stress response protein SCP2